MLASWFRLNSLFLVPKYLFGVAPVCAPAYTGPLNSPVRPRSQGVHCSKPFLFAAGFRHQVRVRLLLLSVAVNREPSSATHRIRQTHHPQTASSPLCREGPTAASCPRSRPSAFLWGRCFTTRA